MIAQFFSARASGAIFLRRHKLMTITYPIGDNLYVNVTNRCTNRCDFCIRKNGDSVGGSGSLWLEREPTVGEIVDDIKRRGPENYRQLVFCGYGEPMMRLDDIIAVIKELRKSSDIPVRINTNGQADLIFGKPTAQMLADLVDTVSISLNDSAAGRYDAVCHSVYGKAAFDAVVKYGEDCKKYVPNVVFSVVDVIPPEEIEECRRIAERTGVTLRVRKMIK